MHIGNRLSEVESRYEQVQAEMASPELAADHDRMRRLGKEFAELQEVVVPYRDLREAQRQAEEARALAKDEPEPEMAAYLLSEADAADARATGLRTRLEQLLITKDPNDDKDVVVEIRGAAGGDEAALWAGELF